MRQSRRRRRRRRQHALHKPCYFRINTSVGRVACLAKRGNFFMASARSAARAHSVAKFTSCHSHSLTAFVRSVLRSFTSDLLPDDRLRGGTTHIGEEKHIFLPNSPNFGVRSPARPPSALENRVRAILGRNIRMRA